MCHFTDEMFSQARRTWFSWNFNQVMRRLPYLHADPSDSRDYEHHWGLFFPERRINGSVITIYRCRHWDGHALQCRFPWILRLFWYLSNASHWLPLDSRASASESMLQQSCVLLLRSVYLSASSLRTEPHIQIYITAFNLVAIMKLIVINSLHWTANWMSFLKGSSWSLNTWLDEHHRVHCLIHLMIKT